MNDYLTKYIIPVLAVMVLLLIIAKFANQGSKFKTSVLVAIGFLLGWASAFISLDRFHLFK